MDFDHRSKLSQLNRYAAKELRSVRRLSGSEIEQRFERLAREDSLLRDKGGTCLMPVLNAEGALRNCGSAKTQRSHVIQHPLLNLVGSGASSPSQKEVCEQLHLDPRYLASFTSAGAGGRPGDKFVWEIGRVPPRCVRTASASTRGFSCNACDNDVFEKLEIEPMGFPVTSNFVRVDDLGTGPGDNLFHYQLFLLSYRAVVGSLSLFRGTIAALDSTVNSSGSVTPFRRQVQRFRAEKLSAIFTVLNTVKKLMDHRVVGLKAIPMVHYLVPVKPAVFSTGCSVAPCGSSFFSKFLYPVDAESRQCWLIMSCLQRDFSALEAQMNQELKMLVSANFGGPKSRHLFVEFVTGFEFAYFQPDGYKEFAEKYPHFSERIEEMQVCLLIDHWYDAIIAGQFI